MLRSASIVLFIISDIMKHKTLTNTANLEKQRNPISGKGYLFFETKAPITYLFSTCNVTMLIAIMFVTKTSRFNHKNTLHIFLTCY